jgi:ribosome-associated protein
LAQDIVHVLEDKKAEEIVLLDVQGICSFADYFIVCTATSDRMIRALADTIREEAHKIHQAAARIQGRSANGWVLADMGTVVTHIFTRDRREYYDLEGLWREGKMLLRIQ